MAAENENNIILNIEVSYDDAIKKIQEYSNIIKRTKTEQELFKKELNDGKITHQEYNRLMIESNAVIKDSQSNIRILNKEIQNNIKIENEQIGSLVSMRAELSNLTAAYDHLSAAERNSAKGKELSAKIISLTNDINTAEQETQRFYRNVGNYQQSILNAAAGGNTYAKALLSIAASSQTTSIAVTNLTNALKVFGKQLLALLANPIVAVFAGIVAVFMLFKKAINSSEEATAQFNAILAPLNRLITSFMNILQLVVGFILKAVGAFQALTLSMSRLAERIPFVGKYLKEVNDEVVESIKLEKDKKALDEQARDSMVENAKNDLEISKLRADAQDKENKTAEERLGAILEANRLEKENADRNLAVSKERLRIAEEEAARTTELSKEQADELARLRAETYKSEQEYHDNLRGLLRQENVVRNEIAGEEADRAAAAIARADKQKAAAQALQDAVLDAMKDGIEKQIKQEELNTARQIEELKNRLKTEKDLTVKAKSDINKLIKQLQLNSNAKIAEIQEIATAENLQKEVEAEQNRISLLLKIAKKGSENEYNLKLQQIELLRQQELKAAEQTGADLALINMKYENQIAEINKQQVALRLNDQKQALENDFNDRKNKAFQNETELANIEYEMAIFENERLKNLDIEAKAALYESQTAYEAAVIESEARINSARQTTIEQQNKAVQNQIQTVEKYTEAFSNIMGAFAEDSEAAAAFQKALAVFNASLKLGEAIANAVAVSTNGDPYTVALRVASAVASVTAAFAGVFTSIKSAVQPKAPKFAQGGVISGIGSGTSDSIPIYGSNGESVMTALTTQMFSPLLSALNQIGGGVPIIVRETSAATMGEEILEGIFSRALQNMPQQYVSVKEIRQVQSNVDVIEEIGNS